MMKRKAATGLAAIGFWLGVAITTAWGQDFQKNYTLSPGGAISIANVSGDIRITGTSAGTVSVRAIKEGRDKDAVEVVDESTADRVSLKVRYASGGSHEANVKFIVEVPAGAQFKFEKLSTASGNIEVANVAGELSANTASGDVTVSQFLGNATLNTASGDTRITNVQGDVRANSASGDVTILGASGMVSAQTASGDIKVEISRAEGSGEMKFASASGDVTVTVPNQIGAQVQLSTGSGDIKSDFPINVEDTPGHGKRASASLGSGGPIILKMSAASGDIQLKKF
jgi:DUF4097 and DUF4098 domain-containing protein YvlB